MKVIDQNTAIASLETALVPDPFLVDGRTEKDRLSFLCDFGALVNFYDNTNSINGNWRPFLLKDPVFLLAHISVTDFRRLYKLYSNTCVVLEKTLDETPEPGNTSVFFNQMFDQVTDIFLRIEQWTYYMQLSPEDYDLRKYVLTQVQENFSSQLWAVLALRDHLSSAFVVGRIEPVRPYVYSAFDNDLWKKYSGNDPYQDVLGIALPWKQLSPGHKENTNSEATEEETPTLSGSAAQAAKIYFTALKNAGDPVFRFFQTIIRHASAEYEKVKHKKSSYPDTTLLRAFVDLLKVHQEEINGIAGKHLRFYYSDILKQLEQPAVADSVFICAVLAKNTTAFDVPVATQFNAGLDANKNPIIFASTEEVSLNSASVVNAYTFSQWAAEVNVAPAITFAEKTTPSVLQTDENGFVQKWATFGGGITPFPKMGFAFGSPMLLLSEGGREITVTLNFVNAVDPAILINAKYALSTAKAWQPANAQVLLAGNVPAGPDPAPAKVLVISITLTAADPAIAPFALPQDGLNSTLPMLQILFTSLPDPAQSPVIASLNISVTVSGATTFQLYNDNGMLSTKTPFQVFGPIPGVNSNFIIGSAEIFSKPILSLIMELDWDNLPLPSPMISFQDYYAAYNAYIGPTGGTSQNVQGTAPALQGISLPKESKTTRALEVAAAIILKLVPWIVNTILNLLQAILALVVHGTAKLVQGIRTLAGNIAARLKKWFGAKSAGTGQSSGGDSGTTPFPVPLPPLPYYNNTSFQVVFNSLQDHAWNEFDAIFIPEVTTTPATDPAAVPTVTTTQPLFGVTAPGGALSSKSVYAYASISPDGASLFPADPSLLDEPLVFDGSAASGFLKMTLVAPSYGFGAPIYGAVVSNVALKNAILIANSDSSHKVDPKDLIPAPNIPFAPKAKALTIGYTASQSYDLSLSATAATSASGDYPLQCFYYTPFTNYTVYDNTSDAAFNGVVFNTMVGPSVTPGGMLLFPTLLSYNGILFIELADLTPANYVNLFFEMARSYGATNATAPAAYFYLSASGWKSLELIQDGTNGFSCPGLVEFNIPGDITNNSAVRSGSNFWIAVAVSGNPSAYAQTVLLTTNGIELKRAGTTFLSDTSAPKLAAGVITKPMTAIPQIATITQPFASFGGKAAEDQTQMNQRVSNRIKTKDRAVNRGDFFRLIREEFNSIYYSKACFDADTNVVTVYVVKQYDSPSQANAFTPLVSQCDEDHILEFLEERTSVFPSIVVSNFQFCSVTVTANITVKQGYTSQAVQDNVTQALKVYLSPWITSTTQQVAIDQGISDAAIAGFINTVDGVLSVSGVLLSLLPQPTGASPEQLIYAPPGMLFVTADDHIINVNA